MAVFVKHTGCDRCGSSDALAHYSDGGSFCFSCGIPSGASAASFVPTFAADCPSEEDEDVPYLPSDLSHDFPQHVIQWLAPTGVTIHELIQSGYFYSKSEPGLLRVLQPGLCTGAIQHLRGRAKSPYENRSSFGVFSPRRSGPKTIFRGSKENTDGFVKNCALQPLAGRQTEALCIVEDSISAIKVARYCDAVPLFGSSISNNKLTRIVKDYAIVYVWLDSDKLNNARSIADRCQLLGKRSVVIYTELDPKYCDAATEINSR